MRAMRALAFWTLTAVGAASLVAQTPPRDASAPKASATGTAAITGSVLADEPRRPPLRRATVSLSRTGVEDIRYVVTDDQGRFQFSELPAGAYTLGASKAAYISTSYGALQPGMPGTSISLTDGQRFTANPIALVRGAVLAGRILDRNNRPVEGSLVAALAVTTVNGQRRLRVVSAGQYGRATTNAHGEYRIFGLVAGDYLLSAEMTSTPALPNGQSDRSGTTPELVAWAQRPSTSPVPPIARQFSYAKTLFPGTAAQADALSISLARGEEKAGVDFSLQYVPVVRVSGVVTTADGTPAANGLIWRVTKNGEPVIEAGRPISVRTAADGTFMFTNVSPGDWQLTASGAPVPVPGATAAPRTRLSQWGTADVSVSGRDVTDVAIRLGPGAHVSGRVVVVNADNTTAPPVDLTKLRFFLFNPGIEPESPGADVAPDGTFTFDDIMPGRFELRMFRSASIPGTINAWRIRTAMLNGRDLGDETFEVRAGQAITGMVVTVTNQMASITGTLVDGAGRPTPQFYVFAFPTNRAFWTNNSRRIVSARADVNGIYTLDGLPAGEYYVCALTELDRAQQYETTYLELLAPSAIKITVGEGEKKTLSLQVGGS